MCADTLQDLLRINSSDSNYVFFYLNVIWLICYLFLQNFCFWRNKNKKNRFNVSLGWIKKAMANMQKQLMKQNEESILMLPFLYCKFSVQVVLKVQENTKSIEFTLIYSKGFYWTANSISFLNYNIGKSVILDSIRV